MSTPIAMNSYFALCSNEVVNRARLSAYMAAGIKPAGFGNLRCEGCEGLVDILPCVNSNPPNPCGYQLPELDDAPWYDPAVPESKNFAGILVTDVVMSSPYTRTVTANITDGQTLGRLRRNGRTITVTGWLIGKTCCATAYGLSWLTSVMDDPCGGRNCTGCDLDFLSCCPNLDGEDECLTTVDCDGNTQVYIRPAGLSEFQRGTDFFRRMHGAGIIDGPTVIECKGSSCGCSCGSLLKVEFTLATGNPFIHTLGDIVVDGVTLDACTVEEEDDCDIVWCMGNPPGDRNLDGVITDEEAQPDGDCSACGCPTTTVCMDDPLCPAPALPPVPKPPTQLGCGCLPATKTRDAFSVGAIKEWSSSTLNISITTGDTPMRNVIIRIFQNNAGLPCDPDNFDDCTACSQMLISYIPPNSTFDFNGENKQVTIECPGAEPTDAAGNVSTLEGTIFDWPDLSCVQHCVVIDRDCEFDGDGQATLTIERVDRNM